VNQEYYQRVAPLIFVYVPGIDKAYGGWRTFAVRVLVSDFRSPFLTDQGFITATDLDALLKGRSDVQQRRLEINGSRVGSRYRDESGPNQPKVTVGQPPLTIAVDRTEVTTFLSFGSDRVFFSVCQ